MGRLVAQSRLQRGRMARPWLPPTSTATARWTSRSPTPSASTSTVSVLPGNGDGTFGAPSSYAAGQGYPTSILALDLNGDGAADLAVANVGTGSQNNVAVLLNSAGKFGTPVATTLPFADSNFAYLAFSDFNHDGKPDLAVTSKSNAIVILTGNGNGTFQTPAAYAVGALPKSMAVVPLADGNTVLFSGDQITGESLLSVVTPQGKALAPQFNFAGGRPTGIAAGDLNGDGQPDVVVTGGSSDVSVMISQGGAQFRAPAGYSLGPPSPARWPWRRAI